MKRALVLAVFAILAMRAMATTISISDYIASLERINQLMATNQLGDAHDVAKALIAADVDSPQGRFNADTSLLDAIVNAERPDVQLRSRLEVTIVELRRASSENPSADPKLLKRVAAEQEVPELVGGGDVSVKVKSTPMIERIANEIERIVKWIGDKIQRFFDWLFDLFPKLHRERPGATGGMRWIVSAVVIIIVLLVILLAFQVARRTRRASKAEVETSEELASKRDEDPLSRGAMEWERYAAQLASTGRFREAIRAWYHAVLVTCYSAGVLHYRKSRTNWEYVSALGPTVPWRAEFIELTRRFEREWYGADQSTRDAYDECREHARAIIGSVREASRGAA